MIQKQQLENIKEKNVHSVSIFGMKFAAICLQIVTILLENGFIFFDYNIFHDDPVFNIRRCCI
jgi:hypothetical protein